MEQFSQESIKKLGEICTSIINDPESNIMSVAEILQSKADGVVLLSLAKVFKNVVPLYKIRVYSDKAKYKNRELSISAYDRVLLGQYNLYVKELCSSSLPESYRAAAELLKTLDHFNFADRIVSKVLVGTTMSHGVSNACVEALADRIRNDSIGDTVFIIIDKCLDCKFSHILVDALLESKYLEKCVQIRIDKETFYEKERIEERRKAKKEQTGRGFFSKRYSGDKAEKKEEKKRLKLQSEIREQEKQEIDPINEKNYVRAVNALQRLYFTILKDGIPPCLESTYIGVRKYIRIIRKEFHEGLYTLLNSSIEKSNPHSALEGILSIICIYKDGGMDFKRAIDVFFRIVHPFNYHNALTDFRMISKVGRCLFLDTVQPKHRVCALIQRLMHCKCVRYIPEYSALIKDLEIKYDIDLSDHEIKNRNVYEGTKQDIDSIPSKPFYEYYLLRKMS